MRTDCKVVEQVCHGCGKHFYLKYCSSGAYEFMDDVCNCEADFSPVEGEPSIAEWMQSFN